MALVERGKMTFPCKLHLMLQQAEEESATVGAISWMPDGRSFKIHNKEKFCKMLMPNFFQASKYKSFQRNLNLWGFETVSKGPSKGICSHPLFARGKPLLCRSMTRVVVKGNGTRRKHPDDNEEGTTGVAIPPAQKPSVSLEAFLTRAATTSCGDGAPSASLRQTSDTLLAASLANQHEPTDLLGNALIQEQILRHQQEIILRERIRRDQAVLEALAAIEIAAAARNLTHI